MNGLMTTSGDRPDASLDDEVVVARRDIVGDVVTDFAAAVCDWPKHPAVVHNDTTVTYRELAARVRDTALRYRACGVVPIRGDEPSVRIGTVVTHTPAVAEHLLGVLAAGGAYCPIDAALPGSRQLELIEVMGLSGVLGAPDTEPQGSGPSCSETRGDHARSVDIPLPLWSASDPAYVLCTSGSTGAPKPVVVSRRALAITVIALRRIFALTPADRVLQFASLGWDTCLEEMLPALTAGATVVFDDAAHSRSFRQFVRMLARQEVTVLDLPTAFWHELVLYLHEEQANLPESVRLVVIGGERVDPTRLQQWRDLDLGQVMLLNTYGCTETTMVTHAVRLSGPGTERCVATADADAPLGRALPHVREHVSDEGELLVAGPGLSDGYLDAPGPTGAAFPVIDHGTGPTRWFRTGDLVARGEHGLLYSRGRTDEQVKVRGVRVHPAEVEAQLCTHPAVGGAVVIGERLLGRTVLAAYVVPVGTTTAAELKHHLTHRLPSQFVPSKVTFVSALSYTASGKVDRSATQRAAGTEDSKGARR